jgi:hypothetical protein
VALNIKNFMPVTGSVKEARYTVNNSKSIRSGLRMQARQPSRRRHGASV